MTRKRQTRPNWAKPLTAKQWRHLNEVKVTTRPTLWQLKEDAGTCVECKWILRSLEELANN
jgi:hypothetical protein